MKASELKIGSILEIIVPFSPERIEKVHVPINRCSDSYVWFKHMGLQRIGRGTIDKYPTLYKIISI